MRSKQHIMHRQMNRPNDSIAPFSPHSDCTPKTTLLIASVHLRAHVRIQLPTKKFNLYRIIRTRSLPGVPDQYPPTNRKLPFLDHYSLSKDVQSGCQEPLETDKPDSNQVKNATSASSKNVFERTTKNSKLDLNFTFK